MNPKSLNQLIRRALREDAADNDITTNSLIPKHHVSDAVIIVKEEAVVCGLEIAERVFKLMDPRIRFRAAHKDGAKVKPNTVVARIRGRTRTLLSAERVALNFLGFLSGIATDTNRFVEKTRPAKVKILDTRKTTPGLRLLEKAAVKCGGGYNHRPDLSDLVLIKDNHRDACRPHLSIPDVIRRARKKTKKMVEIEVDTLKQFQEALSAAPDMILLDNMNCAQMKKAVAIAKKLPREKRPVLEASGGISLRNVGNVARTGVDCISIGSLTHSRNGIDVSLELIHAMKRPLRTMGLILLATIALFAVGQEARAQNVYEYTSETIAENGYDQEPPANTIFDDQMLLKGYTEKYSGLSKEILIAMIKDDTLTSYRSAAAVRVFKQKFSNELVSPEKNIIEKVLLRRLHRTDSAFVEIEILHTLCQLDRYHYFRSMVPALIQKLDHYNSAVNEIAFDNLNQIIAAGSNRNREARIVFNTLRKILFLSRKRLAAVKEPDAALARKLKLLRWSIKVLGNQELKKLPLEVINLL